VALLWPELEIAFIFGKESLRTLKSSISRETALGRN